jgi:C4-dicarboxylate-binding protein DctP
MTVSNHGYLGYMVVISKKFWNKLPNNLKVVIKQAMKEATEKERIWAKELNDSQFAKIKAYAQKTGKLQIIHLTKEQRKAWVKKLRSIYPKFYRIIGKDLIEKAIKAGE